MAEVKNGFVEVLGAKQYYELAGRGHALVLLHEGIADCTMFDDQFEVLTDHYRVLRLDLPGFGRSAVPTVPYSMHGVVAGSVSAPPPYWACRLVARSRWTLR